MILDDEQEKGSKPAYPGRASRLGCKTLSWHPLRGLRNLSRHLKKAARRVNRICSTVPLYSLRNEVN